MIISDFFFTISLFNLPDEIIRYIFSFSIHFFKQKINCFYLSNQIINEKSFCIYDLPYPIFNIKDIYNYLNFYIQKHKINVYYSHYSVFGIGLGNGKLQKIYFYNNYNYIPIT